MVRPKFSHPLEICTGSLALRIARTQHIEDCWRDQRGIGFLCVQLFLAMLDTLSLLVDRSDIEFRQRFSAKYHPWSNESHTSTHIVAIKSFDVSQLYFRHSHGV